jgi:fucose 4-O-acetylase-like acetyltransferase
MKFAIHNPTVAQAARDVRIDSVKGGLMILVVMGHLLEIYTSRSPLYMAICSAIYVFHMPLFVLTAGMFSKVVMEEKDCRAIVSRLIVPLVIFQTLYLALLAAKSGRLAAPPLQPHWILWFLLSMVLWRLALPLFARIRYGVAGAVLIALAAGYNPEIGYAFSLSRTLYFFPFFLLGYLYRERILATIPAWRWPMLPVLALILGGVMWWSFAGLPHEALYGSRGYDAAPVLADAPLLGRGLMLALSLLASFAALAVMSVRSRFLAWLGQRSLSIFVLHGFFIMALGKLKLAPGPLLLVGLAAVAVVIAAVTAFCDPYLGRLYDAIGRFVYRPDPRRTAA